MIQRWWSDPQRMPWIDEHGFLVDLEPKYRRSPLLRLDDLDSVSCLVHVGDGGSGKSTEIAAWSERQRPRPLIHVRASDLDHKQPFASIERRPAFAQWVDGAQLDLVIDGLDEATISPTHLLESLHSVLSGYATALTRLRVRILCRSTVWSESFLPPLYRIFGKQPEQVRTVELVPLRQRDVTEFLERQQIPRAEERVAALLRDNLGPLLARPMLLEDLAKTLKRGDRVTPLVLRRSGLRRLIAQRGSADDFVRLAGAQRIAAYALMAQQPLATLLDTQTPQQHPCVGPARVWDGDSWRKVVVDREAISALRSTALFGGDSDTPTWSHQSWAEFGCAEWIASLDCPPTKRLEAIAPIEQLAVLPEWADATLSYLAMIDPSVRELLVRHAPIALLRSDTSVFDEALSRALIEALLEMARTTRARALNWGLLHRLREISSSAFDTWLASIVADRSRSWVEREIGLMAAWREGMPRTIEAATMAALDNGEEAQFREDALRLVGEVGDRTQRGLLLPLVRSAKALPARLVVQALEAVWPRGIEDERIATFDEMLPAIAAHLGRSGGQFAAFADHLTHVLRDDELARLLIAQEHWVDGYDADAFRDLLLDEAFERSVRGEIAAAIVTALLGQDGHPSWQFRDHLTRRLAERPERNQIAKKVLLAAEHAPESRAGEWRYALQHVLSFVPLAWLYDNCATREPAERWAELTRDRVAQELSATTERESVLAGLRRAGERAPALANRTRGFFEPPAPSPLSEQEIEWRERHDKRRREAESEWNQLQTDRAQWLSELSESTDAFWRLTWTAATELRADKTLVESTDALMSTAWWKGLAEIERTKMIDAAERFLELVAPELGDWYLQNQYNALVHAGRCALELLQELRPRSLSIIDWARWTPVVVTDFPRTDHHDVQRRLVSTVAQHKRVELARRAREVLSQEIQVRQYPFALRIFGHEALDDVIDAIPSLLSREAAVNTNDALFSYLLRHAPARALELARTALSPPTVTPLARGIVSALITSGIELAWRIAIDAMNSAPTLAQAVFNEKDAMGLRDRDGLFEAINNPLLADALILARTHAELADRTDARLLPGRDWCDRLLQALRARSSSDSAALAELQRVVSFHPQLEPSARIAQVALLVHSYRPRTIPDLRALEGNARRVERAAPNAQSNSMKHPKRLFTWLHLSDIHFGQGGEHKRATQHAIMAGIPEKIEQMRRNHTDDLATIDAVIVTGDVAFAGTREQYDTALTWLDKTLSACGVGRADVYVVPGNHDVNIKARSLPQQAVVEVVRRDRTKLADFWNAAEIDALLKSQAAFWEFAEKLGPITRPEPTRAWWHTTRELTDGRRLVLLGLNSALLSTLSDDEPKSLLALGAKQIAEVTAAIRDAKRGGATPVVIALMHHPLTGGWLGDGLEAERFLKPHVSIFAHGHIHESDLRSVTDGSGARTHTIMAGATQQAGSDESHQLALCSLVQGEAHVELLHWPLKWNAKHAAFLDDPDVLGGKASPVRRVLHPTE